MFSQHGSAKATLQGHQLYLLMGQFFLDFLLIWSRDIAGLEFQIHPVPISGVQIPISVKLYPVKYNEYIAEIQVALYISKLVKLRQQSSI